jgi:flagellar biosynthesis/type III secretory pathway protein FliH
MTFHLVHADGAALLASDTAVIKRDQRVDFADAAALLQAASAIRDQASAVAEAARIEARAEGLAEARATVEAALAEQIAGFAEAIEQHEAARRSEIAAAALAAVRAIVGSLDDETLVTGIVERTLARLPAEGPITVQLAPSMADGLAARLADRSHVTVVADPALGPTDCVLRTSAGQVIASLSVQLAALAKRWGVAA